MKKGSQKSRYAGHINMPGSGYKAMGGTEMEQKEKKLEETIRERLIDHRLSCAQAHQIADELNISLAEIGDKANELGIKITKCMLGCF
jgi:LAO/AO transport system kinase